MFADNMKFVDLSQPLFNGIPLAGVLPRYYSWDCLELDAGDSVNSRAELMSDHTGTHVDAARHVVPGGKTLDQYPVDAFSGRAICLDVRAYDGMAITREVFDEAQEKACRKVKAGDIVLFCTNHSKLWGPRPEGLAYLKNRAWVDPDFAKELVDMKVKAVGIDLGGPDPLGGSGHPCHHVFLENDVMIIESLGNLEEVLNKEFFLCCFPIKFQGSTGAPARAVAIVED